MGRLRALLATRNRNIFSSNCLIRGTDIPQTIWKPENYSARLQVDDSQGGYDRESWIQNVMGMLDKMGMEYDVSDCYVRTEKMEQYEVVFAASYNFMESWIQEKLLKFSEKRGKKLYLGPNMPEIDRRGNICEILQKNESIKILPRAEKFSEILLPKADYRAIGCEISVHKREHDKSCIIFVANTISEETKVEISFKGKQKFYDMWNHTYKIAENHMNMVLKPFEIRVLKVKQEGI